MRKLGKIGKKERVSKNASYVSIFALYVKKLKSKRWHDTLAEQNQKKYYTTFHIETGTKFYDIKKKGLLRFLNKKR